MIAVAALSSMVAAFDDPGLDADEPAIIAFVFALVCGVIAWRILSWTRDGAL